jgi:hypothetical protein
LSFYHSLHMHLLRVIYKAYFMFILLLMLNFITNIISSYDENKFLPTVNFDPQAKKEELLGERKISLPYYYKKYGTLGKNFELDEGKPFIWCEQFNDHDCKSDNITDCLSMVKCFPELRSHHLGCMAVLVYNTSSSILLDPKKDVNIVRFLPTI